jgi:predicted alpha/beta superfamily hydrolase
MKYTHRCPLLIAFLTFAWPHSMQAQSDTLLPKVEIPSTQVQKLNSSIVGQEYSLYINLPVNYLQDTGKVYPVVYLLDAQYDFPFMTGVYGGQYYDGFLPEFITVGITWGGKDPNAGMLRGRDFTPTSIAQMPSGQGPKFLAFIKTELIPFIQSKYRVTNDRTLMGSSLGGLFTLYALFNDPSLFHRYVLTSPAVQWDNGVLRTYEQRYEEKGSPTPVKLFMGKGALETDVADFQQFAAALKDKKVPGLELQTMILENTGHAGTKPEGYARGLQWAFEKPDPRLSSSLLDRYAGTYVIQTDTVYLSKDKGELIVRAPGNTKLVLQAETDKDFYVKGVFLKVHFKTDAAHMVTGFQLEQFEGGAFAKRIN